MRWVAFTLLLPIVAGTLSGQPADPKPKTDQELLQGTWLIVGLERGGKLESEKSYKGNSINFAKDKATLREGPFPSIEFSVALDPTRTPKMIDLTVKGNTLRGVYKLDGDDLVLCISVGGPRPTDFTTKAGGDTETFTLKRSRWEKYVDKTFGFTIDMPGKLEERTRTVDTPTGPITTTFFVGRSEVERLSCLVSVTPLPDKLDEKGIEPIVEATRKVILAEIADTGKTTIEVDQVFKTPDYAGRDLNVGIEMPGAKDKTFARARMFVVGNRLYALVITAMDEGQRPRNLERFWASFKPPEKK